MNPLRCFTGGSTRLLLPLGGSHDQRLSSSAHPTPRHPKDPKTFSHHRDAKGAPGGAPSLPHLPVPILIFIPFQSPRAFLLWRALSSSSPLPQGPPPAPAPPFPWALYKQKRLSVCRKKSCIMQMGKSDREISHSENPHSGPAPRFPWHGQSLLEPGLHTDERGDEISTKAHR